MEEEKEQVQEEAEIFVSEAKLKKLRNLKMFREWTNEQIIDWVRTREKNKLPPANPRDVVKDAPPTVPTEALAITEDEYNKLFKKYLTRYRRELGVDMNNANDAESLRSLVRYAIQLDLINKAILNEQRKVNPYPQTLKGLGDFQRTVQQNINESQDRLGVSRKQRKDREHGDDITEYTRMLQEKARNFWERKTVPVRCEKCRIELARYWLNFPDMSQSIKFELTCDRCHEKVLYVG